MRHVGLVVGLLASACGRIGFHPGDVPDGSGEHASDGGTGDGGTSMFEVAHLPPEAWPPGSNDVVLGNATIDTTMLSISPPVAGVALESWAQVPPGPELAVLRARTVQIAGTVDLVGSRPLVIIADEVRVSGTLDASASGITPGAGGAMPGAGPNRGMDGDHFGTWLDSGGGGAGGGTLGGSGGASVYTSPIGACTDQMVGDLVAGGAGGAVSDDLELIVLDGGSSGGDGGSGCGNVARGGAGGGAIQLTATRVIVIEGAVAAGGGGGRGATTCAGSDGKAAGGGGAGGAIYLQAPLVAITGMVAANGGAGGGGHGGGGGGAGGSGEDGQLGGTAAAGGTSGGQYGGRGGDGGADEVAPIPAATSPNCGNAGGGGGAVGRIVARTADLRNTGTASPAIRQLEP